MINQSKKILVTCALPYANGPIHIGHLLEHIQADIWVRYHRMIGKTVFFICADDSHGTAIMLKAKLMSTHPEKLIKKVFKQHLRDLLSFNISYDNYSHTHSKKNLYYLNKIFFILKNKGYIKKKNIFQLYDFKENIFLPDRLVKGTCPRCLIIDQYGDHCENCGCVYNAKDLIDPKSQISGITPILKSSTHFFFNLPIFEKKLKSWINSNVLDINVKNKIKEWFKTGLKLWDISRDAPYFGFKIPGYQDKYFYVWLDAPICYISTFKNFCEKNKSINFKEFWKNSKTTDLYHFIGKDIIYFHSIFWPAILEGINFRKPTKIFVHGYVTLNKKKMSKSKNELIKAQTWLKFFDSDSLRYYFACKSSCVIQDIEFNLQEFINRINSDIVNKIVNLAARCARFINDYFDNMLSSQLSDLLLYNLFLKNNIKISEFFKSRKYSSVVYNIIKYAEQSNNYINSKKPWNLYKKNKYHFKIQLICTMGINLFRFLITWLKPIMPNLVSRAEKFLNIKTSWESLKIPLLNHKISKFSHLYHRLDNYSDKIFE